MIFDNVVDSELKGCPRCGSKNIYRYTKMYKCVACRECAYFNTESNWNTGLDYRCGWDNLIIQRIRALEERVKG